MGPDCFDLNCALIGADGKYLGSFQAVVRQGSSVSALQYLIWQMRQSRFRGSDADSPILWKVCRLSLSELKSVDPLHFRSSNCRSR